MVTYMAKQYFFYPADTLEKVFGDLSPAAAAALHAPRIEEELLPFRLDAETALEQHHTGVSIGHPVFVLASVLKKSHNRG
jgi:hypothetical protein